MQELKDNYSLNIKLNNHWDLGGTVTFNNVTNLEKESKSLRKKLTKNIPWLIDLAHIKKIDSAGLSWLLVNLRYAKKHRISLNYENITNPDMKKLMSVQGVDNIIK
ncbi:MAG: ABC-type transporter Mla MlaB component [Francisellaceae bacterium]|jgi:ABC-type transporter Mla MlaB component